MDLLFDNLYADTPIEEGQYCLSWKDFFFFFDNLIVGGDRGLNPGFLHWKHKHNSNSWVPLE